MFQIKTLGIFSKRCKFGPAIVNKPDVNDYINIIFNYQMQPLNF